jgi:hypothetical protein
MESIPEAPSNLNANFSRNDSTVQLSWTNNADNETFFIVEIAEIGDVFRLAAETASNLTSFQVDVDMDGNYKFRIAAGNQSGTSAYSNEASTEVVLSINSELASKVTLYPNPAENFIRIKNDSQYEIRKVQVSNANGQLIRSEVINENNQIEINVSGLNSGLYFITLHSENGSAVKTFIIK